MTKGSLTILLFLSLLSGGCGNAAATPAMTPDPCLSPDIAEQAQQVHRHMREFDDASTLAFNVPQPQLQDSIADLERIRQEAELRDAPACLANLKAYQLEHMELMIGTLRAFMTATNPENIDCVDVESNTEEAEVCQTLDRARERHDRYLGELARVLGITAVPAPSAETLVP